MVLERCSAGGPTSLDAAPGLVYHAAVVGSDPDAFEAVDVAAWQEAAGDLAKLRTPLTPSVTLDALATETPDAPPVLLRQGEWTLVCEHDDPRMEVAAEHIAADLAGGAEALWLRVGLDHGVRVLTPGDLGVVLAPVDLAAVPLFLEPEVDLLGVAGALFAVARHREVPRDALRGCLGADPVGTLLRTGELASGLGGGLRDLVGAAHFCRDQAPGLRAVLVSSASYHDGGATPSEEIAWSIATAIDYVRTMQRAGLTRREAVAQLQFKLCVGGRVFVEIAKLRAFRRVWALVSAATSITTTPPLHVASGRGHRTTRDPWVNQLRGTAEVFAAALGGADSIACAAFDAEVGPSDLASRRFARNLQLVLRDEAHLARVHDPAAGSHALEDLTDQLAREAWALLQEVEERGGMLRAVRTGFIGSAVAAARAPRWDRIARRMEPVVGVSEFPDLEEVPLEREPVALRDVEVELGNVLGEDSGDPQERHQALLAIAQLARQTRVSADARVLVEAVFDASLLGVDNFSLATLLRSGRGSLHAEPLMVVRPAAPFEGLRAVAERFAEKREFPLRALVVDYGAPRARVEFMTNLLATAGIPHRTCQAEDVAEACAAQVPDVGVVCAPDDGYGELGADLVAVLKAKGARFVLAAGRPSDREALEKKGLDAAVGVGDDVLGVLVRCLQATGALR